VAPRPLENQRSKHQKTDRLDARALLDNLESYLRGNRDAMSIGAAPSPEPEPLRSVVRHREQLVRNRRRGERPGAGPDPGNRGPREPVASSGLEGVSNTAPEMDGLPAEALARGGAGY
jgi:hypothetical protein